MRMFEDLMISYRGAGVIGTCLAFFVLASAIGLSLFVFDPGLSGIGESSPAIAVRQEQEIGRLSNALEQAETDYDNYRDAKRFSDEVKAHDARQQKADDRVQDIAGNIEKVQSELAGLRSRHESYASAYREQVRDKAEGEVLPTIELPDGRRLESPVIVKVNPAGIQVRYKDGIVRVSAKDLPEKIRERFQFDANEMERFLEAEKAKAGKLEFEIERDLVELKQNSHKERIAKLEKQSDFLRDRVAACAQQYSALRGNQRRHYKTLVMLIRQVEADERALRICEAELERLKAADEK